MLVAFSRGLLVIAVFLLVLGHGTAGKWAVAGSTDVSNAKMWLDKAVIEQRCPSSPGQCAGCNPAIDQQ